MYILHPCILAFAFLVGAFFMYHTSSSILHCCENERYRFHPPPLHKFINYRLQNLNISFRIAIDHEKQYVSFRFSRVIYIHPLPLNCCLECSQREKRRVVIFQCSVFAFVLIILVVIRVLMDSSNSTVVVYTIILRLGSAKAGGFGSPFICKPNAFGAATSSFFTIAK